jgi:hypothetical protein
VKFRTVLFSLLLLALPLAGFSQSTLNFPRLYEVGDLGFSDFSANDAWAGFTIVNPSAAAASVTFTFYNESGSAAATTTVSVPARQQYVKLGTGAGELFTSVPTRGWIQATSATTGLQGFWLGGIVAGTRLDGAEASPVGQEFIFPLATATTELNLVSLSSGTNTLTIRLYAADGTELATAATQNLPERGAFKANLNTIFTSANFANARYIKVSGTGAFTGTTLSYDFILTPSWSVVNGIDTELMVSEINFPHVPSGPVAGEFTSVLGITNMSASAQTITITYNRPSPGTSVSVTRDLPARGSLRASAGELFTGVTNGFSPSVGENGWIKVTGTAAISGFIAYGLTTTGGVAVVPMQATPATQMIFAHVATGAGFGTGLALLNATTSDAAVEVFIMRLDGTLVGGAADAATAAFTIPAGTKYVGILEQFVSTAGGLTNGFVFMRSTNNVPIYGFQLFYTSEPSFAAAGNVAAGSVHPSITFTPPAPATPLPTPAITSLTSPVNREATLTITGTGFSATPASNAVFFTTTAGTLSVTPSAATTTSLTVTVPITALNGPVYVRTNGRFSPSVILEVYSTGSALMNNTLTVSAGQNSLADIYVSAPAGATLNITGSALTATTASTASLGTNPLEITRGETRRLWLTGDGISSANGSTVSVTGSGITITVVQVNTGSYIGTIVVNASATTGPRSIIVLNSNKDQALFSGGLIVR